MSELIDRQAAIEELKSYIIDPKKAISENPDDVFQYNAGIRTAVGVIMELPTASPWHRVDEGLPKMRELVPGYVCSEILVLYDAESKYADIGYAREKPDNGVDWLWGKPRKNPTHWTYFEPPKEDA